MEAEDSRSDDEHAGDDSPVKMPESSPQRRSGKLPEHVTDISQSSLLIDHFLDFFFFQNIHLRKIDRRKLTREWVREEKRLCLDTWIICACSDINKYEDEVSVVPRFYFLFLSF